MFRSVQLPDSVPGRLLLHSMPGRYEDWEIFTSEAGRQGLQAIACLVSELEIFEKSPSYAAAIAGGSLPWQLERFPIADFSTPRAGDLAAFQAFIAGLAKRLRDGETILVHCGAGIGRTGTAAVCTLIQLGLPLEKALVLVRQAGSHSETPAQMHFVRQFADKSHRQGTE